jgi:hypothetical protein
VDIELAKRRSESGWAHLTGVLRSPSRTYAADVAASFWGVAFVVACVCTFLAFLIDVRAGEPAYTLARTPVWAGLSLLAQRGITGVARRVCWGDPDISGATTSQAAIVMNVTPIPSLAICLLLPTSTPAAALTVLVGALGLGTLVVALWLVGKLYSAAFDCSVGRGVAGEIAGIATVLAAVFGTLIGISMLFDA